MQEAGGAGAWARRLLTRNGRPLRFALAGTINTIFGFAVYPALLLTFPPLRVHYMVGLVIAQVLSLCFAYMTYKLTVFRTRANVLREVGVFSSFYIITSVLNWGALPLMVEHARVDPIMAQVGFSFVLMVSSYFWHSRLTFRATDAP